MIKSRGPIPEARIFAFEQAIGFRLPEDYRVFLRNTNGGLGEDVFVKSDRLGEVLIDVFFGLDQTAEVDLHFWHRELQGELPEHCLCIGSDPGGGFFVLAAGADIQGVFYYDHSYQVSTSSDSENTYRLSVSFAELISASGSTVS